MAEPKPPVYVEVSNFTVKESFDPKYKSSLPKVMIAAVNGVITSPAYKKALTNKKPSDKSSPAIFITGALSLTQTPKGASADITMPFGKLDLARNAKSMKGALSGSADAQGATVEDLVQSLVTGVLEDDIMDAVEKSA